MPQRTTHARGSRPFRQDEATPLLCATAFDRPARVEAGAQWTLDKVREFFQRRVETMRRRNRALALLLPAQAEDPPTLSNDAATRDPGILTGEAYARWVMRRIVRSDRRLPVVGLDQEAVAAACHRSLILGRCRRLLLSVSPAICLVGAESGLVSPTFSFFVALPTLLWTVLFIDRVLAQSQLNTALDTADTDTPPTAKGVPALAYTPAKDGRERMPLREEQRFIGAGLEVRTPPTINVDVTKGRRGPSDTGGAGWSDTAQPLETLLNRLSGESRREPKEFTLVDLYEHVAQDLRRTVPFPDTPDHHLPVNVIGIWGTADRNWEWIDDKTWEGLPSIEDGLPPGDTAPDSRLLRPYLWARIIDWSGQLIVSVLVRFARREEYLRIVILPQAVAPLVDEVTALRPCRLTHPVWLALTALQAAADVVALPLPLLRPRFRRRPEIDPGTGPVSLRETYSKRRVDDLHMLDDLSFLASTLQRRVFSSVESFLEEHDIDTGEYKEATTNAVINFGVTAGTINGSVSNHVAGNGTAQQGDVA